MNHEGTKGTKILCRWAEALLTAADLRTGRVELPLFEVDFVLFVASVVPLFHRDLGGAGRPPLVILPGFLGSSRNWQTAGAGLAARFHVQALDLRNHGRSPGSPEMTFDAMIEDVLGWMNAQDLATATLLGHSM